MKTVIAIDSFKGSISTFESGEAVAEALALVYPDAEAMISPLADGGEGTVEAIVASQRGFLCGTRVSGPLGEEIRAEYGIIPDTKTAVIEMSAAAGLPLVPEDKRNPLYTTTYGVGELISHAIRSGCRKFIIGIGGSATNDGGVGMLSALGYEFTDEDGNPVPHGAIGVGSIKKISTEGALPELAECEFHIACDVKNPLCGEMGASAVYGPQKGATPDMVKTLDAYLAEYARLTKSILPHADESFPGAGAAGGIGFAFHAYLGATLESGIDIVVRESGLEKLIADADLVITGEGRLDEQTSMGKAPIGVARVAKKYGKTVIAFSGCVTDGAKECNANGIDAFFPIPRAPITLSEAMNPDNAYKNLRDTAEQVFRLYKTAQNR